MYFNGYRYRAVGSSGDVDAPGELSVRGSSFRGPPMEALDRVAAALVIYTSDNGYHVGGFRSVSGKPTPFGDDSNVPLVVRGPGIPSGLNSTLPASRKAVAKFLGWAKSSAAVERPHKREHDAGLGTAKEIINIEHWGCGTVEAPTVPNYFPTTTYKTIRLAGDNVGWLYIMWCTGESELYDIIDDPYKMTNLINSTDKRIQQTRNRLNALVLYMKSCGVDSCQDPWGNFDLPKHLKPIKTFKQAMRPEYDTFFSKIPIFELGTCMDYQYAPNETPFYPPQSVSLGFQFRGRTDGYVLTLPKTWIKGNEKPADGWDQRNVTIDTIMKTARYVTKEEIFEPGKVERRGAYEMDLVGDVNGS
ncbi:arylsulfatase precursor [Fusarium austroafricanum]|uniref:Arylsulfatase n=1 Tax=Fusarium austroafricanum TaxID=2364996 RepID=A0A8H4KN30_9HYPO|nr:arylsulfatase precursor [Fusarium austroafricanum]